MTQDKSLFVGGPMDGKWGNACGDTFIVEIPEPPSSWAFDEVTKSLSRRFEYREVWFYHKDKRYSIYVLNGDFGALMMALIHGYKGQK